MAPEPELIGVNREDGVPIYLLQVPALADFPQDLGIEQPFALLLAGDARNWDQPVLDRLAGKWIESGLAYACCWGDGCEWVHDLIDQADLALGEQPGVVMTTWHDGEVIADAVVFLAESAVADDQRFPPIKARLAAVVGDRDVATQVRNELKRLVLAE